MPSELKFGIISLLRSKTIRSFTVSEPSDFEEAYGKRVAFEGERKRNAGILEKETVVKDFAELPSQFQEGKNFVVSLSSS